MTNRNVRRSVGSPRVTRPARVSGPVCRSPQRGHHAVVPEDPAVDADRPQVQLPQRPAEKRLQALCRQRHEPPRHLAARHRPLGNVGRHRCPTCPRTGASTPPRRPRPACARPAGRWPPPIGSSPGALRRRRSAPHSELRQLELPPAKRHLPVDTPAPPRGPLDLMAPLRTTQDVPIRPYHRLQDLQPGRDAQDDME